MDPISEVVWPYFVSLFVGIIIFSIYRGKKRVAKLESIAKDLGFEFSESGRNSTISDHKNFELFQRGASRKLCNELWRSLNGNDFSIFEYSYRQHGGNTRHKTVLLIRCSLLEAPVLSLRPKLKRLMMVPDLGQYDPGINISPVLSQHYVVKGDDEVNIRAFFKPSAIKFFETNSHFHLEAQQNTLTLYNSSQRSGFYDVEKLYAQGQELLSRLID